MNRQSMIIAKSIELNVRYRNIVLFLNNLLIFSESSHIGFMGEIIAVVSHDNSDF
jgi:hypothetical protein